MDKDGARRLQTVNYIGKMPEECLWKAVALDVRNCSAKDAKKKEGREYWVTYLKSEDFRTVCDFAGFVYECWRDELLKPFLDDSLWE